MGKFDDFSFQIGFDGYMKHQQGAAPGGGASCLKQLTLDGLTPESVFRGHKSFTYDVFKRNIANNPAQGFKTTDADAFLVSWVKYYNAVYNEYGLNSTNLSRTPYTSKELNGESSTYDELFFRVSKDYNIPLEIMRTFAYIESTFRANLNDGGSYLGLFQVSKSEIAAAGYNPVEWADPEVNTRTAFKIYARNVTKYPTYFKVGGKLDEELIKKIILNNMNWGGFYIPTLEARRKPLTTHVTNNLPPDVDEQGHVITDGTSIAAFVKAYGILLTPEELIKDYNNESAIFNKYNSWEKQRYGKASVYLIKRGTVVEVPLSRKSADKNIYLSGGQTLTLNKDYNTVIEDNIKALLNNPQYKRVNKDSPEMNGENSGILFKKMNTCSVWVWSKALDLQGTQLINITPFLENLSTSQGENGGNFSLTLPHLTYERKTDVADEDTDKPSYKNYVFTNIVGDSSNSFVIKNTQHVKKNFNENKIIANYKDDNDELKNNPNYFVRKPSFFNVVLQKNDLIFIRFEQLGTDKVYNNLEINGDFIQTVSVNDLPGNTYDLIGIVDDVTLSTNGDNDGLGVSVRGRDLSKLVIDDTIYNFVTAYAVKDKERIIQNANKPDRVLNYATITDSSHRVFNVGVAGSMLDDNQFNFFTPHSVQEWITYIISQLTNISLVQDSLFNNYKDKSFIIARQRSNVNDGAETGVLAPNDTPNNSGKDQFNNLDFLDYSVNNVSQGNINTISSEFSYKKLVASGIWQIVKLVFDTESQSRRVQDASLSTNTGSLLNSLRKYAQSPFFQLNMDTYGDKYYFMVRKPPFTYQSFITNACLNLFEQDILNESLVFDAEFYSMYQITPMNSLVQSSDGQGMLVMPAVLFPEMVSLYGLRNLEVISQFMDFDPSISNLTNDAILIMYNQLRHDMQFLLDTNLYLPFTRKGSITIKGDRRFKRGMNVRHMGTGEIFYIDNVHNNAGFSGQSTRTTTLEVSRGMVEQYLEKYFNLCTRKVVEEDNSVVVTQPPETKIIKSKAQRLAEFQKYLQTLTKDQIADLAAQYKDAEQQYRFANDLMPDTDFSYINSQNYDIAGKNKKIYLDQIKAVNDKDSWTKKNENYYFRNIISYITKSKTAAVNSEDVDLSDPAEISDASDSQLASYWANKQVEKDKLDTSKLGTEFHNGVAVNYNLKPLDFENQKNINLTRLSDKTFRNMIVSQIKMDFRQQELQKQAQKDLDRINAYYSPNGNNETLDYQKLNNEVTWELNIENFKFLLERKQFS